MTGDYEADFGSKITSSEEEMYGVKEEEKDNTVKYVVFRLDSEWYGVEIVNVKEILRKFEITFLPAVPDFIKGIVNLRGNIYSVTDLKVLFNLSNTEETEKTRLVVVEHGALETALYADEITEVKAVPVNKIDPPLVTISKQRGEFILGEFKSDDKLVAVLSVEKIFDIEIT
jgi:purine-binding chemotaxis protein CheW